MSEYKKVRGHHCWWLSRNGVSIANFDINGNVSDEMAESYVDEIIALKAQRNDTPVKSEAEIGRDAILDALKKVSTRMNSHASRPTSEYCYIDELADIARSLTNNTRGE